MVRKRGGMVIGPDGCGFDMRSPSEMEADDARREADEAAHAPRMAVTSRIRRVAQPPDGYLPLSLFDEVRLADPVPLYAFEDVPADVTGLAVDYLSRVARRVPARDAFRVPLAGARLVGRSADAERLLAMVDGFSDRSVRAACLLCGFDAASRRGPARWRAGRVIDPGPATVYNVRRMVARTLRFMDRVGPVVWEGFTFDGGYTDRVTSGDGDLLTADGLWDLKVSRWPPNPTYTLQLLVYWRLGLHSTHPEYLRVRRLGLYNARSDTMWSIPVARIGADAVRAVERDVIGYADGL